MDAAALIERARPSRRTAWVWYLAAGALFTLLKRTAKLDTVVFATAAFNMLVPNARATSGEIAIVVSEMIARVAAASADSEIDDHPSHQQRPGRGGAGTRRIRSAQQLRRPASEEAPGRGLVGRQATGSARSTSPR